MLSLSNTLYGKSLDLKDSIKAIAPASAGLGGKQGGAGEEAGGGEGKRSEEERLRLFSFAVSQVLDMPLEDQQLLLQTQDTAKRLSKQITLLHKAKSYLAAQLSLKNVMLPSIDLSPRFTASTVMHDAAKLGFRKIWKRNSLKIWKRNSLI